MSDRTRSLQDAAAAPYEPPQVEQVLTEDVLVREVHYAGDSSADSSDGQIEP